MPNIHSADFTEDVYKPGPNGLYFPDQHHDHVVDLVQLAGASSYFIMQDDADWRLMTGGAGAYATYANGPYAAVGPVSALAKAEHAAFFTYAIDDYPVANAIDIETGAGQQWQAVPFYRGKSGEGVFMYSAASRMASISNTLAASGIARNKYKYIAAHFIGSHICGPHSCGYPQADATQFTETYLGRSLDATLCPANLFSWAPAPAFPLSEGMDGDLVATVQKLLNKWAATIDFDLLKVDGDFGPGTEAAVVRAQEYFGQKGVTAGIVNTALYADLQKAPPPPANWVFGPVTGLTLKPGASSFSIQFRSPSAPMPLGIGYYEVTVTEGDKLGAVIPRYPRKILKGGNPQTWQGGGLAPGHGYIMGIRAVAADGSRAGGWVTVNFQTT
jgi:peptidoglycan hydrolase-like protein with peptidoglycan-binding domain